MQGYAERIYVLVHRCHEQCLKMMHSNIAVVKNFPDIGINTRQGIILKLLSREDGLTQKDLTRRLEITSSSCGELITKLEQGGYLEKRTNPSDKRTFNVYLTDRGRVLAEQYKESCNVELEEWASDLTQQEQEQLFSLLGKLSKGLDDRINKEFDKKE